MIEIKNVTKTYNSVGDKGFKALKGVDFEIKEGEFVAIMGPSGSGKSTLMHILGALDTPSTGKYYLDGKDISKLSDDELANIRRNMIGFVFQAFNLLPRTSVIRNVVLPLVYAGVPETEREIKAQKALRSVGLPETHFNHMSNELSGGQIQRVAIARAMLKNAPILLLDEATSALDSESEELIQDALWKLMDGRTTIVIAHRLSTIQKMDRILVMDDGKIIEEGTHKELVRQNGSYANLWQKQSGGFIED